MNKNYALIFSSLVVCLTGFLLASCNKQNISDEQQITSTHLAHFDSLSFSNFNSIKQKFTPSSKRLYYYEKNGQLTQTVLYRIYKESTSEQPIDKVVATYKDDVLVETNRTKKKKQSKVIYQYTDDMRLKKKANFYKKGEEDLLQNEFVWTYDKNLPLTFKSCRTNGCDYEEGYSYDHLGRISHIIAIDNEQKDTLRYYYTEDNVIPYKVIDRRRKQLVSIKDEQINHLEFFLFDQTKSEFVKKLELNYLHKDSTRTKMFVLSLDETTLTETYKYDERGNLIELIEIEENTYSTRGTKYEFRDYIYYPRFVVPASFAETGQLFRDPKAKFLDFMIPNYLPKNHAVSKVKIGPKSIPSTCTVSYSSDGLQWVAKSKVDVFVNSN